MPDRVNQNVGWRFPFSFSEHGRVRSVGGQANTAPTVEEVKEALRVDAEHLLTTGRTERVMNPNFGVNAKLYLFMPLTSAEPALLKHEVVEQFDLWVGRVEVLAVAAEVDPAQPGVSIRVRTRSNEFPVESLAEVVR